MISKEEDERFARLAEKAIKYRQGKQPEPQGANPMNIEKREVIYKDINGYEGLYQAGSNGQIKSLI